MEEKTGSSFYEFLASKGKNASEKKVAPGYVILAWVVIFLMNSLLLWFCWNQVYSVIGFRAITFLESICIYTCVRVLTRGIFSSQ